MMYIYDVITQNIAACDVLQAVPQTASIYMGACHYSAEWNGMFRGITFRNRTAV